MVRIQYGDKWTREPVEDFGTFKSMFEKYGSENFTYWCAQMPPYKDESGGWAGYRLDGTEETTFKRYGNKTGWSLARYSRHKAWIHPTLKIDGKQVILVANAQFDVGTFGTVTSASVGINTVARLNREKRRKARARARKHKSTRWHTSRRTKRKYRAR